LRIDPGDGNGALLGARATLSSGFFFWLRVFFYKLYASLSKLTEFLVNVRASTVDR
jgi:hypothetical protein